MGNFILSDIDRTYLADLQTSKKFDGLSFRNWEVKNRGHSMIALPFEGHTRLNPTGPPGFISGIYLSLVFQLRKWEHFVQKFDEVIEVNPVHQQYYQLTIRQKQELEGQIKSGLASASQSVADLELLKHDERKYREFLDYFGYEYDNGAFKEKKEKDEHSLRSVFIDQVDVHTGEGIAMRSIVSRWPTLMVDFMKLKDEDVDTDKVKEKLDISKAEAVVLVTKNKLYFEWKKLFGGEIQNRYRRIVELVRSRENSMEQYREWLKPYVARHKMIQEGLGSRGGRETFSTLFATPTGHAAAYNEITLWAWREMGSPPEFYKGGSEFLGQELAEGKVQPYDEWTKRNLIFHPKHGLIADYPWITEKWVKEQESWLVSGESMGKGSIRPWIDQGKLYYGFFIIGIEKLNIRLPTGSEMEDGTFDINFMFISKNVLFAKLLELQAKKADFNHYVDSLIGVRDPACPICSPQGAKPKEEKGWLEPARNFLDYFNLQFQFAKGGPYDRDFDERVTKYWIRPAMAGRFAPVVKLIKQKAGMGQ